MGPLFHPKTDINVTKTNLRLRSLLIAIIVGSNALVAALTGLNLFRSYEEHEARAGVQSQNVAKALDQTLSGSAERIDLALRSITDELERQLAHGGIQPDAMKAFLSRVEQRLPEVEAIRVCDANGQVILGRGLDPGTAVSWSDREYFIYHRDHADRQLQISKPRVGRVAKTPIIGFAQRYDNPNGSFAGVVSAPIAVDYFTNLLSKYELGGHGIAVLRDTDLGLITRWPAIPDQPAGQIGHSAVSNELRAAVTAGANTKTFYTAYGADGKARINTMVRLSKLPMILIAGVGKEDYLASWYKELGSALAIALGYLLASLLAGGVIFRLLAKHERDRQTLADNQARLQAIYNSEPECIKILDQAGRLCDMNPAGLRIIGAENLSQVLGQRVVDLISPADQMPFREMHEQVMSGQSASLEFEITSLQGERRWLETHAAPMRLGRELFHLSVTRDISARKQAENDLKNYRDHLEQLVEEKTSALLAKEAQARHILDSSADGIYGVDQMGRITFINRAACELLGVTAEEVIGQSAHQRFHHHHADGRPYPIEECPAHRSILEGHMIRVDDQVYWHSDGHMIPVMYAVHPVIEDDQIKGAVTSFIDVSELRAAGEARERALLAAENLARMRSEFIANVSHEIRTPLNGILGFAEIGLRVESVPDKARDAFNKIRTSGRRLLGVINDILDFSAIEAGKLGIEPETMSIPQLLAQAVEPFHERAQAKGLKLLSKLGPNLPDHCQGDATRLVQVLGQIIDNAIKFTTQGEISVAAEYRQNHLHLCVSDTGIGMTPSQLSGLYTPFQQGDGSDSRHYGGTGLGLAICKRILELMGGSIHVTSQPGVGSIVNIAIPCPELNDDEISPNAPIEVSDLRPLAGFNILIAEDEPINQAILPDLLEKLGARSVIAANGREAVECVALNGPHAFDFVLMDLMMPEMDGYEAASRIRTLAPDLPIIAQTVRTLAEVGERCRAVGMVERLSKPLAMEEIVDLVRRHGWRPAADRD